MPIFDQGYQHWQGQLTGHGWRWLAVTRHGVRAGMTNRNVRMLMMLAWVGALAFAGVICGWGMAERKVDLAVQLLSNFDVFRAALADPTSFRVTMWSLCFHWFIHAEMFLAMILVLIVGPSLISQDLRFNALPLYFSRPVRRIDYFMGKLGVIGSFLGMVVVVPAVAAWVLGIVFSPSFSTAFDTANILFGIIIYGVVATLSAGLLMLALSSLSRNSRYVAAIWAGLWILTNTVAGILDGIHMSQAFRRTAEVAQQEFERDRRERVKEEQDAARDANDPNMRQDERNARAQERWRRQNERQQAMMANQGHTQGQIAHEMAELFRDDWRPCISYTANLLRIGDGLIGYYRAQDRFNALRRTGMRMQQVGGMPQMPPPQDEDLESVMEPRWPWYWSALVLIALGGLSAWILNTRVKTMDRLR